MNLFNAREALKNLLLKLSYEKRAVRLSSGKMSDFYFDGKQTSLHPEGMFLIGHLIWDLLSYSGKQIEAVGGPTLGADPIVTAISFVSVLKEKPIPAFIVRKEAKKHGTGAWIEGEKNLEKNMQVALVEDVITSGASLLKAADRVTESGYKVIQVACILDREEGGKEAIESQGYPMLSIFKKSDLF